MNPLIFFRIGWMDAYNSNDDKIQNGGSYVDENGRGGEMWNFQETNGKYYGYVMTKNGTGIDLSQIIFNKQWKIGEESPPIIDVVFIAKKPKELGGGQVVVGWYKNATIFHKEYRERDDVDNEMGYVCEAFAEDCKILEVSKRIFNVPKERGFIGQNEVWYANENLIKMKIKKRETPAYIKQVKEKVRTFKEEVKKYVDNQMIIQTDNHRKEKQKRANPNKDQIVAIEKAAVQKTWAFYESKGYELVSVEADNVGWDIEATKAQDTLLIEVKGHCGNIIQFELTPNEYSQLKEKHKQYRVCVVCNALTKPNLMVLIPKKENDTWILLEENGNRKIKLNEKVAAKAEEVE